MADLSDRDIDRIAKAAERAVMRATLRAFGYVALVALGAWIGVTLLATTLVFVAPAPGQGMDLGGWILLTAVLAALAAGAYAIFRMFRTGLR
jgi:hypothetical protein